MFRLLIALLLYSTLATSAPNQELSIATQRKIYQQALTELRKNNYKSFQYYADQISSYPLHQYLEYEYVLRRVAISRRTEIDNFLARHANSPKANIMRQEWIRYLGKHQQWSTLLDYVVSDDPVDIQCLAMQGKKNALGINPDTEKVKQYWLSPKSQPHECDEVFRQWKKDQNLTPEIRWQRFVLAVQEGNIKFARYLAGSVVTERYRKSANLTLLFIGSPLKLGKKGSLPKSIPEYEQVLAISFEALIKYSSSIALQLWPSYRSDLNSRLDLQQHIDHLLGIRLARQLHPEAEKWLLINVADQKPDKETQLWQFQLALRKQNWLAVLRILDVWEAEDSDEQVWRQYWRARATEELTIASGRTPNTRKLFSIVPQTRHFYSFLAADRLNIPYQLDHESSELNNQMMEHVKNLPGIARALELYARGNKQQAVTEWRYVLIQLDDEHQVAAANLAMEWGWLEQGISTLALAGQWNELNLRFPMAFPEYFNRFANSHQIEVSWLYAIARQESAFNELAESSAGARGLMQVLPSTAKHVADRYGIKYRNKDDLLQPKKSIEIGSAYVAELLHQYDANPYLATAAYNAGYSRVKNWLLDGGNQLPFDIWVETIPFTETRSYVKRIMTNRVIYAKHLHKSVYLTPGKQQLPPAIGNWPGRNHEKNAGLDYAEKLARN